MFFRLADMLSTSRSVPPLYIEQLALRSIEGLLRDGDVPLAFGLLIGNRYFCPRASREYLLIDEVVSAHIEPSAKSLTEALTRELREVAASAERRGRLPIGWFVGGADVLEPVAREDLALHTAVFPEAWQVMLLRDGVEGDVNGAFVRIEPSDGRPYAIRFFELIPDSVLAHDRVPKSVVRWKNYSTEAAVVRLEGEVVQQVAPTPKDGILRRLSGFRRRTVSLGPAAATANGVVPHISVATPPAMEAPSLAPSPAASDPRAPNVSPPSATASVETAVPSGNSIKPETAQQPRRPSLPPAPEGPLVATNLQESISKPTDKAARRARKMHKTDQKKSEVPGQREAPARRGKAGSQGSSTQPSEPTAERTSAHAQRSEAAIRKSPRARKEVPTEIRLTAGDLTIEQGESIQLAPTVIDVSGRVLSDVAIRFATSDRRIVRISPGGEASSVGPVGSVVLTIRAGRLQRLVTIDVVPGASAIEVRPSTLTMPQHGAQLLEARLLRATGMVVSGADFTFTSSNQEIVNVSANGHVTSVGPSGVASISVQSGSASFVVQVTVVQVPTSVNVSPNPANVNMGSRRRLAVRVLDAVGVEMKRCTLDFTSSDPRVVAVSNDGVLSAGSQHGEAEITVRVTRTNVSLDVPVTVASTGRHVGKVAANLAIPGAYCAVIVSSTEAYVAPLGAPVSRANFATGVVSPIPASEGGLGIAFCEARGEIYAAAYLTNTIDVISVSKQSVIATIDVADQVLDIVVSRDARFAYLGLSSGVGVLDLQSRDLRMIDVPVFGLHLALHPSESLIYVSGNAPEVSEIDLRTGTRSRTFALTDPALGQAVAVAPNGASLYVANEHAGCVDVFDLSTGRHVRALELPWEGVWGLTLGRDNKTVFASAQGTGGLVAIDTATGQVRKTYPTTGGYRLVLSPDGLTLLAAGAGNGLLVLR